MGFADELRKTPDREKEQKQKDWRDIEKMFVDYIKEYCRQVAGAKQNECTIYLSDFVSELENNYTSQEKGDCSAGYAIYEIEYENCAEARLWERVRNNFYFYICDDVFKRKGNYPNTFGMSQNNVNDFSASVKRALCKEGLDVKVNIRKEICKVYYEEKYVEHTSKFEKFLTGSDGHYIQEEREGECMYSFSLNISW